MSKIKRSVVGAELTDLKDHDNTDKEYEVHQRNT